jgi:FkbM family methyltransferase
VPTDCIWAFMRNAYRGLPSGVRALLAPLRDRYVERDIPNARRRLHASIQPVAARIIRAADFHKGARLFVDCGFNKGEVLQGFCDYLPDDFKYYGFEVNEPLFAPFAQKLRQHNPSIMSLEFQAVSDKDGDIDFFSSGTDHGLVVAEATTIIQGMPADDQRYERPQKAKAIDFSKWVDQLVRNHTSEQLPYLVVKMDIEGAEYIVLEHMDKMGTLGKINFLIIEFHSYLFADSDRHKYEAREERLRAILADRHVEVLLWG